MPKKIFLISTWAISFFISFNASALVFEVDKRLDIYEIQDHTIQELAKSVFTFVPKENLTKRSDGQFELAIKTSLKDSIGLCSGERFGEQPSIGTRCSGFLSAPTSGVTAGHCVSPLAVKDICANYYVVFDYSIAAENQPPLVLEPNSVRECNGISKLVFDPAPSARTDDYAVINFTKPVLDRKSLSYRKAGTIHDNEEIFMLGFPHGLPEKISPGRNIVENADPSYFSTNLDCFHGNSGSPVFNARTFEVEGIFVRGEGDIPPISSQDPKLIGDFFKNTPMGCYQTLVCRKSEGCSATMDATRITRLNFN